MLDEKAKANPAPEKKFELSVDGKLENLAKIGLFIDQTMRHYSICSSETIYAVQLSVDEACTNIIEYGYSNKTEGKIVIRCSLTDKKFVVEILDWAEPFDPTTLPKPDTQSQLDERKTGGLGIYLMRKYMDEVSHVRLKGMNLLTIAKYIKK